MNNEIKEIDRVLLNVKRKLQFSPERRFVELFDKSDIDKLLDYITNLQEENEKFKDYAKNYLKSKIDRKNEELELVKTKFIEEHNKCLDYKSRNEKAIEKIIKIQENAIKYGADHDAIICQELLNILEGDKDE